MKASDMLREEQKMRGILEGEVLKMVLDVKTRWNSTYHNKMMIRQRAREFS